MNELKELESGIARLKRDSQSKKVLIGALEKEKAELLKRSDELSQRIVQTNEAYKESARKIMDFVNSQTGGLKTELAELSNSLKMVSELESRLESQEASHSKALSRIEKDLVAVNKSLSDVDAVKKELAVHRQFVQEAKVQMEKGLQSGVAYLRKEMDLNRRDEARKALDQFRQEIERISGLESELNAYRQSQETRVDRISSDLASTRSALQEVKLLRERSASLEDIVRGMGSKLDKLHTRQRTAEAVLESGLSKKLEKELASFRKDISGRRTEDVKQRLSEFRQEIERISGIEESLKANEKRMDKLSKELSGLHNTPQDIRDLRESIEESLHMNHSLADRTVSVPDFDKATKSISRRMEEMENRIFSLDKRFSSDKGRIEKSIIEVLNEEKILEGTQKNIKDWFDAKLNDIEKRVSSGLDALTTQMEDSSALMDRLRQRSQKADLLAKDLPKKVEGHEKAITRLIDSKSGLAASLGELSGELGNVSGNLSQSLQRIASLEKGLSASGKSMDASLGKLSTDLAAYQGELRNQSVLLSELSESSRLDMANLRTEVTSALKGMGNDLDSKAEKVAEQGLRALREKTSGLASIRDMSAELKVIKSNVSQLNLKSRETAESLSRELEKTRKSVDSRFDEITEEQASQFKKEFDYISKNIDSIRGISSDIKVFSSRLGDLERLSKNLVSQKDFADKVELLDTRISDLGIMAKSQADELKEDLDSLRSTVTERFNETKGSQLTEFKNELQRIASLEKEMGTYERITEDRIKELSKEFSDLQALPSEMGILKERISSLEDLSGSLASSREFSQKISHINSVTKDLQAGLAGLDKRISRHSSDLEASINEALAEDNLIKKSQKGMGSLIDSRIADVDKRLTRGLEELSRDVSHNSSVANELMTRLSELGDISEQADENNDSLNGLKERMANLEAASKSVGEKAMSIDDMLKRITKLETFSGTVLKNADFLKDLDTKYSDLGALVKTLPKTVDRHSSAIDKIMESKDSLSEATSSLQSDLSGLSERMASFQERLAGVEKSSAESGKPGKALSEIVHLKDRLVEIDKATREISKTAIPESEFVETVKSISKRIDDLESQFSGIDKRTAMKGADLDAAVSRALTGEKLLEVSQDNLQKSLEKQMEGMEKEFREKISSDLESLKESLPSHSSMESHQTRIQESLEKQMEGMESRFQERISDQVEKLESGIKEISSLKEEMARVKAIGEHLDSDVMSRVGESMARFTKMGEKSEKRMDSLAQEIQEMNEKLIKQRSFASSLDQKIKAGLESQDTRFRDILKKELINVDTEISEEAGRLMKEAEIGELKRKSEFDKLLSKFQEVQIKTQQNLEDVTKHRDSFLELERSLRNDVEKHKDSMQAKVSAGQELLKKRLIESENMNMKLNNMVSELQMRLEKEKTDSMGFKDLMSDLREDLIERMKANEDMFDTEMDSFRARIDGLVGNLGELKASGEPGSDDPSKLHEMKVITESLNLLDSKLNENKDDMRKFKQYVTEYINNLVRNYEKRMGSLKQDVDWSVDPGTK